MYHRADCIELCGTPTNKRRGLLQILSLAFFLRKPHHTTLHVCFLGSRLPNEPPSISSCRTLLGNLPLSKAFARVNRFRWSGTCHLTTRLLFNSPNVSKYPGWKASQALAQKVAISVNIGRLWVLFLITVVVHAFDKTQLNPAMCFLLELPSLEVSFLQQCLLPQYSQGLGSITRTVS